MEQIYPMTDVTNSTLQTVYMDTPMMDAELKWNQKNLEIGNPFKIYRTKRSALSEDSGSECATRTECLPASTDAVFPADITHSMKFVSLKFIFLSFPIGY